jgi:hypothetical protein
VGGGESLCSRLGYRCGSVLQQRAAALESAGHPSVRDEQQRGGRQAGTEGHRATGQPRPPELYLQERGV